MADPIDLPTARPRAPRRTRRRVSVVFVHGTWARGIVPHRARAGRPRWFEPGSALRERLLAALLDHRIDLASAEHLEWSGANAILHRDRAARLLAEKLDALHESAPNTARLVIGHSHGGNICLRAFAHLRASADGIGVATVATPFVEVIEGTVDRSVSVLIAWVAATALILRLAEWVSGRAPAPFLTLAVTAAVIGGGGGLVTMIALSSRIGRRAAQVAKASSHAAYRKARPPTLVLRGFDDEASLTLGFGALAARLSHVSTAAAVGLAGHVGRGAVIAVRLGLFGFLAYLIGDQLFGLLKAHVLTDAIAAAPAATALVVGFALLEGAAPMVFGRELFLTFLPVQVNSNSVPDAGEHVRTVTLAPGAADSGLRHALHAHPDCADRIAAWLAG